MQNKNKFTMTYLHNPRNNNPQPRHSTQPISFDQPLPKSYQKLVQKSSLVFLSTLMQVQNNHLTDIPSFDITNPLAKEKEPQNNVMITNDQFVWKQPKKQSFEWQKNYLLKKGKKAQKEEKSIVNLIGKVRKNSSKKLQMAFMSRNLQRNRTFSSIPAQTNQKRQRILSYRKQKQPKKQKTQFVDQTLQLITNKKKSIHNKTIQSTQNGSIFIYDNRKRAATTKANETTHLYSSIKQSKVRSRIYNTTQYTRNKKKVQVESIHLKTSGDSCKDQGFPFRWTQMGHKRFFKVKTEPV